MENDDTEEEEEEEAEEEAVPVDEDGIRKRHCWIKPCLHTYSMALSTAFASPCCCNLSTIRRKPFNVDSAQSLSPCEMR